MRITALCRAGPLGGPTPTSLPDVDDNHSLIGHDCQTELAVPAFAENDYVLTSCRVGPVSAGGGHLHLRAAQIPAFTDLLQSG